VTALPEDPIGEDGISGFSRKFAAGATTSEAAVRAYLDRINRLDGKLSAYEYVDAQGALEAASAIDRMHQDGIDLGPLMGIPVAIKDLFAVEGMPLGAGSKLDVADIVGSEGPFVKRLRELGCIILGKTKTVEFALGITGDSRPRGTPRNPWDSRVRRVPGGSSSGSAVALAAGLCGFAVGSDTGGSVRAPASLCGVVGLKTTHGRWPLQGAFPLVPHLDSIGLFTRSSKDAALIVDAYEAYRTPGPLPIAELVFGVPQDYFLDDLDNDVRERFEDSLTALRSAGARVEPIEIDGVRERESYFPPVLGASLIGTLGRERFERDRHLMDPLVARRAAAGLDVLASDYFMLESRRQASIARFQELAKDYDAFLSPTVAISAPPAEELLDASMAASHAVGISRNTQPGNYLGLAGISLPSGFGKDGLPTGLQIMVAGGKDRDLLSFAMAIEEVIGFIGLPDLSGFCCPDT